VRIFAALVPPPDAVEHLDEFLAPRRAAAEFRWTLADQFHVTLAFVEKAEDWRVDDYVERLGDGLAAVPVAAVRIAGPVTFPNPAAAKILAADLVAESEGADDVLRRLAGRARSAAVSSGLEVDGARFRPHVTLARLRHPVDVTKWVRLLETYVGPAWAAAEVEIVASHLGEGPRGRPRYETVATLPVGGR
jgi:2'-5' RNA ligase